MPAHTVNESTVSLSTSSATRLDPTPNAKRYKVVVVNPHASDRIFVGFANTVTTSTGSAIEADFGQMEFWVDNNVPLYAIRGGSNTIAVVVKEYCTA